MSEMSEGVTSKLDGEVLVVRMDDGKANALSPARIDELHAALDAAEADAGAVCLTGRGGMFCAGYDLNVMRGDPVGARALVRDGGELLMRLFLHPQPTVVAVTGHALAAGALLVLAVDTRIGGEDLSVKIGLNETAIGLGLPEYAMALARARLGSAVLTRAALQADLFDPTGAVGAGFLDRVVPVAELEGAAVEEARRLAGLPAQAYAYTKHGLRRAAVDAVLSGLDDDVARMMGG
jgi:enoyl-CoA hydratase